MRRRRCAVRAASSGRYFCLEPGGFGEDIWEYSGIFAFEVKSRRSYCIGVPDGGDNSFHVFEPDQILRCEKKRIGYIALTPTKKILLWVSFSAK